MTSAAYVVRTLELDDADAVAALYRQSAQHLLELGYDGPFAFDAAAYRRDGFGSDGFRNGPAFAGIGAVPASGDGNATDGSTDDARLAGYLLYTFGYDTDRAQRHLVVLDLLVDRRCRSLGLGALLMAAARQIAHARGVHELSWRVHERNTRAIRFYERLGAELSGEIREMHWVPASDGSDASARE